MGRPIHFEIHASEPEKLVGFYTELFGWAFSRWGDEPYWLATTGPDGPGINGAIVARRGDRAAAGQPVNAFVVTVEVTELDAALATAQTLGATVAVPKQLVPNVGWLAYVNDPDGNIVGMLEPAADNG
jgi:uncharacterized protein